MKHQTQVQRKCQRLLKYIDQTSLNSNFSLIQVQRKIKNTNHTHKSICENEDQIMQEKRKRACGITKKNMVTLSFSTPSMWLELCRCPLVCPLSSCTSLSLCLQPSKPRRTDDVQTNLQIT